MELGEKLRAARQEAGLSQRQLCGDTITRNMLSLIENGSARPSMDTLKYLAGRLGKPVSFFLDEKIVCSPNQALMESARRLYDAGAYAQTALVLEGYRQDDALFDREAELLGKLARLAMAEQAIRENRIPYARELLEKAAGKTVYCGEELERRRLLLLGKTGGRVSHLLPDLEEELLLRAREALEDGRLSRAAQLLEAVQDPRSGQWHFLRGEIYLAEKAYAQAACCYHKAEADYPRETAPRLEQCYRELEDYKRAYEYACKGR